MFTARSGPFVGPVALALLLAVVAATRGLGWAGWVVGLTCGVAMTAVEVRGLVRHHHARGPADMVTLARTMLACAVAALVTDAVAGTPDVAALVTLAAVALALDAVDGWVARRTRTSSTFGAWFDGEVDAFLILVLSVHVAPSAGAWVLTMGAARYVFGAAGWWLPWMRAPLPPRDWRKVATATAGIALVVAASGVAPAPVTLAGLLLAFVLLAESFARDVLWLWARRPAAVARAAARAQVDRAAR